MDTFELLPTLAQGELSETSAPELVAAAFRSRASGTLWVETPEKVELRVYFRAGDMCGAAPSEGLQTLAHVLLANEWVSALEIESTGEEAKAAQKRHGEVLLAKGLLTPEKLRAAVHAQNVANLGQLLAVTAGSYDWRGWEAPPAWAREMVGPGPAMVAALENPKHAARRKRVLDWLGVSSAKLSADWPDLQDRLGLEPLERRAAEALNLPRKPSELIDSSRLPQARGEALLVTLLLVGAAEAQETQSQPPPAQQPRFTPPSQPRFTPPAQPRLEPAAARILTPPASPAAAPRPPPTPRPSPAAAAPPPMLRASALRPSPAEAGPPARNLTPAASPAAPRAPASPAPKKPAGLDLQDLVLEPLPEEAPLISPMPAKPMEDDLFPPLELDTSPRPAPVEQTRAQRQDAAMAQLDALLVEDPNEPPLEIDTRPRVASHGVTFEHAQEPVKSTFEQQAEPQQDANAKELRKKMLARGMRNLGNGPGGVTPPAGFTEEPLLPEVPPQPGGKMTEDERRFADDALDRLKRAGEQSAYARLGVSQNATQEAIKAAYLTAAKRFHPDRANGGLASMQGELQKLFGLLKDAYESLSTKDARERYDQSQRSGGQKAGGSQKSSRKEEAAMAVKMGEVLFKKRDFEAAITKLRRAVDLDGTGDALAALAWALVADPKATPATKEEAATLINKALRAEGVTARTFYVAGVLWRTKDPDSAVDAFRKALEMDPKNADAALELRLIEQRRGKQSKPGGGVLSGLLFGKRKG